MKKFLLLLIIILIAFTFTGCVEVEYSRIMGKDASVTDRVVIRLDEETLSSHGYTVEYAVSKALEYIDKNGYEVVESDDPTVVIGEKRYETLAEFREVYGTDSDEDDILEGFFFRTAENLQRTPFWSIIEDGSINFIKDIDFPNFTDDELSNIRYVFKYVTTYKSVVSDAVVTKQDGYYVHEWDMSADEAQYGTIYISQTIPNATGWYFVAIIIAIVIVGVGYIVVAQKRKSEMSKEDGYGK